MRQPATTDPIRLDYNNMMASAIGAKHGIAQADLDEMADQAAAAVRAVQGRRVAGRSKVPFEARGIDDLAWMDLPQERFQLNEIQALAEEVRANCDDFVVLGIGGSALGNTALVSALCPPYLNELSPDVRGGPRIYVLDNVDPVQSRTLFEKLDLSRTAFNAITKSGSTAETISHLLIARERLAGLPGPQPSWRIIATTDRQEGPLYDMAKAEGYPMLIVPDGVGGRFSVLSPVGLLTAAVAGIDVGGLLAGAAAMDERCQPEDLRSNPALINAALQYLSDKRGRPISVMMPYAYGLYAMADWYRQLWAESLGKADTRDKKPIHCGPTPVKALGATDQHSQVQLYMEGPPDKVITFLAADAFDCEWAMPGKVAIGEGADYLAGHSLNELLDAERIGTELALTMDDRPNCTITLPRLSAHALGQLIYMLEVQTAYAGEFYNINAFDQPGVELGKLNAQAMLGRPGEKFERQRRAIAGRPAKNGAYIV